MSEPLTKKLVDSWTAAQLKEEFKIPGRRDEIVDFMNSPEGRSVIADAVSESIPSIEDEPIIPEGEEVPPTELVLGEVQVDEQQIEQDRLAAEAAQAEANKIVADLAKQQEADRRTAELRAAGITILYNADGSILKIIKEYQAKADDGTPLGRPTHLEARNWEELSIKQENAHVQATKAFHRLKNQKTTFNRNQPAIPQTMSDEELVQAAEDMKSDDIERAAIADRKIRANQILLDQQKAALDRENLRQKEVSLDWLMKHPEFNRCQANSQMIASYIKENDLEWTVDNLELAYTAVESQLTPKVVAEATPPVVDNPPTKVPVTPAPTVPAITPAVVAAKEIPVVAHVVANPQVAAPRPGVNSGLVPGQMSAPRPVSRVAQGLSMKEIHSWSGEQMRKERINPARKAEIDRVIAAYNKARVPKV